MDGCDGIDVRSLFGYDALVNLPSIGMSSNSMPGSASGAESIYPIWDSLNQMEYLQSSSLAVSDGQHPFLKDEVIRSGAVYCHLAQDHSVSSFFEDPRIFSEMIGPLWEGDPNGGTLLHGAVSQDCRMSRAEPAESPAKERRRKRGADENEVWKRDPSKNSDNVPDQNDEKKQKTEGHLGVRTGSKRESDRKAPGTSNPNYFHVRARQGQATNSHSLAERVRREKISERMRVLQDLVPGCSKITGKAVMLDKIIDYVQSLQQQIEFLAMKLATVSPEITSSRTPNM